MHKLNRVMILFALSAALAQAQEIQIQETAGQLAWNNALSNAVYKVEWSADLQSGAWFSSWNSLTGIQSDAASITAAVPLVYRVVAQQYNELTDLDACYARYSNALHDAQNARPEEISTTLRPLRTNTPGLVWQTFTNWVDGTTSRWIKVASFKYTISWSWTNLLTVGPHTFSNGLSMELWVTPYPDLKNVCQAYRGTNRVLRMQKALGLPPQAGTYGVAEIFIDPKYLLRPAPDPGVGGISCGLAPDDTAPFLSANALQGCSAGFVAWYAATYDSRGYAATNNLNNCWPWTRLGYTYDWENAPNSPYGLSEYYMPNCSETQFWGNALVIPLYVESRYPAETYGQ